MSLKVQRPAPVVWRSTPALHRSMVTAVCFAVLALLFRRPELGLLAAPFTVHALRAWFRRAELRGAQWSVTRTATVLTEGSATTVDAQVNHPATVSTLAWTPGDLIAMDPPHGVASGRTGTVKVEPRRWGRHGLGPGVVAVHDTSGAWESDELVDPFDVRVRPRTSTMVGGSGVRTPLGINGVHISGVRGEGTEIAEVRQYRPGDRMRRINWRVSSRTEDLHVVDAHTERETDVLLVLDTQRPALEMEDDPTSSLDLTVRATMAIARHYLDFGDRIGIHDLGHRVGDVPLRSGAHQLVLLNEVLSRATRDEVTHPVPLRPTRMPRAGTLVFVCTPLLDPDVLTEIGRLRNGGGEVVVIDTWPPRLGRTKYLTSDTDYGRMVADAWVVRRLQREGVLAELQRHGVPVTQWEGPTSLAAVLLAMEQARHAPRMRR